MDGGYLYLDGDTVAVNETVVILVDKTYQFHIVEYRGSQKGILRIDIHDSSKSSVIDLTSSAPVDGRQCKKVGADEVRKYICEKVPPAEQPEAMERLDGCIERWNL